jgi:hypothetical protein
MTDRDCLSAHEKIPIGLRILQLDFDVGRERILSRKSAVARFPFAILTEVVLTIRRRHSRAALNLGKLSAASRPPLDHPKAR